MTDRATWLQMSMARVHVAESLGLVLALTERQQALGDPQDEKERAIVAALNAEVDGYMDVARASMARFEELLHA